MAVYSVSWFLVEIPYLIVSSLFFTLPFFYIIGFENTGNVTVKFFWYWLFQGLYLAVLVYFGQLYAALYPTQQVAAGTYICIYSYIHMCFYAYIFQYT
jgi:ABC-type multidrug transport system permease subunit